MLFSCVWSERRNVCCDTDNNLKIVSDPMSIFEIYPLFAVNVASHNNSCSK